MIALPGLASAHGHAFQRALRGRAQRGGGSFWSWRGLMYALAERIGPEELFAIARLAYAEMAAAGYTAIGEFHYLQHQPDGTPYADRTLLADTVVRAAREAGLRITLLRVLYARGGWKRALEGAQCRFADRSADDALRDVQALRARWSGDEYVRIGVAPHSVRAAPIEWIEEAARLAEKENLPLHMHVAEQRREVRESLAEHGLRPVELLRDRGIATERLCAVHATHLNEDEIAALAKSFVCVCRTTERDLGDGLAPLGPLIARGAKICFGADSHAIADPFEEARAAELDERTRTEGRAIVDPPSLLAGLSEHGYAAIGQAGMQVRDEVVLDESDLGLLGAEPAIDAAIFAGGPRAVREVRVGGEKIVEDGRARDVEKVRERYLAALRQLAL